MHRSVGMAFIVGVFLAGCAGNSGPQKEIDPGLYTATVEVQGMS